MNRKQVIAITFQDRGRVLFESMGTLISQLEVFGDFHDEFPKVDTEADELAKHLYEALASARRLRNATSRLVTETEEAPSRRSLNSTERMVMGLILDEHLYMWRGRLSWREGANYTALTDKQVDAYNELLDRGLVIAPEGHGEPAKVVP